MNPLGTPLRDPIKSELTRWRMAVKWTPPRTSGKIPGVSTRFSLNIENEQTDAGRDGRTCLTRPNSQARTATGKNSFSLFSLFDVILLDSHMRADKTCETNIGVLDLPSRNVTTQGTGLMLPFV